MGQVAITFKVMPESLETDIKQVKKEIHEKLDNVRDIKEMPIAFGLVALEVLIVMPDAAGGTDQIEKTILSIAGVSDVETSDITLL